MAHHSAQISFINMLGEFTEVLRVFQVLEGCILDAFKSALNSCLLVETHREDIILDRLN
jgi:hypothetical protein